MKSGFVDGKLMVQIKLKEKESPAIFNILTNKGSLTGDIDLQHYIYRF